MTDAADEVAAETADDGTATDGTADDEVVVCKLGGSVITDKEAPETVDEGTLAAAAGAVADAAGRLVLVHGGGSFGHHHAAEHGLTETDGTRDAEAALAVHEAMVDLNHRVVGALRDRGVPALPHQPLSAAQRSADGALSLATAPVRRQVAEGFVPVVHGDVVAHEGEGATVLSGDELVVELAAAADADRVGVCSTVPGVLDGEGAVVERIESFAAVADVLGASEATDVTGGMAGKVRALLSLDVPVHLFGPDALPAFFEGEAPGTTIDGR